MSLKDFSKRLRTLPLVVAHKVAQAAAPALTAAAQASFAAGETPYGDGWLPSPDGKTVTLRKSGALMSGVRYVAIGTRLRVALTTRYAKYVVGKRPVTPRQGSALPTEYTAALKRAAAEVITAEVTA